MATGYCPAVLTHLSQINPETASNKVTHHGFLVALLTEQNRQSFISTQNGGGHTRTVNVAYSQRGTKSQWQTNAPDCDIDVSPALQEVSKTITLDVSLGISITEAQMRQYCQDASRTVMLGTPATPFMDQFLSFVLDQLQGGYAAINDGLLNAMASKFGRNPRSGTAGTSPTSLNIPLDGTLNNLSQGLSTILTDAQIAEICGNPFIVGNGNFHSLWNQYKANSLSANQSGVNTAAQMGAVGANFHFDQATRSKWGDNQIGVFDQGAVQFLEFNKYVGNFAGEKGAITDFQFFDPRVQCWTPAGYQPFAWDATLRFNECATTFSGYAGSNTYTRNWIMTVSKTYDLWTPPTNLYDGNDPNVGQNGTLRYTVTNA